MFMRKLILAVSLCLCSCLGFAQVETQDSTIDTSAQINDVPDNGEAGGVNETPADQEAANPLKEYWLYLALGAVVVAVISSVATRALTGKKNQLPLIVEEPVLEKTETKTKEPKATVAELKKLKQEIKEYQSQLQQLQAARTDAEQKMEIYRNFDSSYFNEAFRKLVVPMSNALESGSRKEMTEYLLKIMMHFSSLTRYKIAKKQPFDEANIHYLLNQKGTGDTAFTEINGNTPIDKIPKNIQTLITMLKEHNSNGLDDSIIAGYKIRNL